ncbi:MAG: RtcB family protein [Betaproteobacteria bacterium]|nr:RtcB family protein [Betaproteobacteria bacterium]MCL2885255.1 RtcB family protein [Betaproteobacteria bacterium]
MIEVKGTHNTALCYCGELEPEAFKQIKAVCDRAEFAASRIRIMPDVHAGKGCTIGTTMTITDKIVPGMVGVDIGCGMETVRISWKNPAGRDLDFARLDRLIRAEIPSGRGIRKSHHALNAAIDLDKLRCAERVNVGRARLSIGTLGGGNHFIELGRADDGALYLVVHSGSRHLGQEVATWYQKQAFDRLSGPAKEAVQETIATLKAEGREQEIEATLQSLKPGTDIPKDLTYAADDLFDDYLHDMRIVQRFAVLNRQAMTEVILDGMGLAETDRFTTIHNYIDTAAMILRKGSVSAKAGEHLLIPINMRDGSLLCVGKGNAEWNYSAPHGAGRLMSRTKAFNTLSLDEFHAEMKGVFSTSVQRNTLDESPMVYKNMDEILSHIQPTVEVIERIRTVYNFKAGE